MNVTFTARGTPAAVTKTIDEQLAHYVERYGDHTRIASSMRKYIGEAVAPAVDPAIVTVRATCNVAVTVEYPEPEAPKVGDKAPPPDVELEQPAAAESDPAAAEEPAP